MFNVSRAFLSVHAALWSSAGKGLASLVFSFVPTNFADVYYFCSRTILRSVEGVQARSTLASLKMTGLILYNY